jgi:AcrR family transcriptional regulator
VSGAIDLGPARIEPYVFNPVPGALFLWLDLRAERGGGRGAARACAAPEVPSTYTRPMDEPVRTRTRRAAASGPAAPATADRPATRSNDPERTRADILRVAEAEFAEKGLAGARIDEIAAATRTSKRMIYYYFGSKEGLYLAVLEEAYRRVRDVESELNLKGLEPEQALRRLVAFTFDHHLGHEGFIRLVMAENIERGQYLARSPRIEALNVPAIAAIRDLYERGVRSGVFRRGLDPVDIHASISALCFFNVSNRHTFGLIFKLDMRSPAYVAHRRDSVVEMVVRFVRKA